jgi:uncharacterized metal-binding protein YceD (DUF177 family)
MSEPLKVFLLTQQVPSGGKHVRIMADEAQRRAIATELGIEAVEALTAELDVKPIGAAGYTVGGTLSASVIQADVVTLDPVRQDLTESIDLTLMPEESESPRAKRGEPITGAGGEDERDLYRNGRIDLGAIVFEHLALSLDPYPRAPDTEFSGHIEDDPARTPSAFAALASLKPDKG